MGVYRETNIPRWLGILTLGRRLPDPVRALVSRNPGAVPARGILCRAGGGVFAVVFDRDGAWRGDPQRVPALSGSDGAAEPRVRAGDGAGAAAAFGRDGGCFGGGGLYRGGERTLFAGGFRGGGDVSRVEPDSREGDRRRSGDDEHVSAVGGPAGLFSVRRAPDELEHGVDLRARAAGARISGRRFLGDPAVRIPDVLLPAAVVGQVEVPQGRFPDRRCRFWPERFCSGGCRTG